MITLKRKKYYARTEREHTSANGISREVLAKREKQIK